VCLFEHGIDLRFIGYIRQGRERSDAQCLRFFHNRFGFASICLRIDDDIYPLVRHFQCDFASDITP
jgi:hypothetical protein